MKLSKQALKAHERALQLVHSDRRLSYEERVFIVENFHEGANHEQGRAGAFFTPPELARDFAINVGGSGPVVDLCAGIGALAFAVDWAGERDMTCIERNGDYAAVGKRVVPHAQWVVGDALDVAANWPQRFEGAISNPPFGRLQIDTARRWRYQGNELELRMIELASRLATHGAFILPQGSCPFAYSGRQSFASQPSEKYQRFHDETGIRFELGVAVDTAAYQSAWHGASPLCEVVVCEFDRIVSSEPKREAEIRQLELI